MIPLEDEIPRILIISNKFHQCGIFYLIADPRFCGIDRPKSVNDREREKGRKEREREDNMVEHLYTAGASGNMNATPKTHS